ncbi:MAG: tetraacyldisaccharide 4'-kinase [Sphingobacteriia bacterium]|jgi:tetraacyldisaccharide 4'-kinase|nr:tetraacyldisaccharide 4'-kinase [Sphingobacteriia bacterium]
MKVFRFLLYPFALVYGIITIVRNFLFDTHLLSSKKFDIPTISIGNISVGGTGKTPHSEYLIRLLQKHYQTAFLSRGYRRKTHGFMLADATSNAQLIGDEPFQVTQKFPKIQVAVDEKRVEGIEQLLQLSPTLQVVLLDDAFQHRYVQPGLSILLTDYHHLWTDDFLLPYGRLREPKCSSKRANIVIVTKCPENLSERQQAKIRNKLKIRQSQSIYFTTYCYATPKALFHKNQGDITPDSSILLVTGVVSAQGLETHLRTLTNNIQTLKFPDHHFFSAKDICTIMSEYEKLPLENRMIIVTEKDAARLTSMNDKLPNLLKDTIYSIGIEVSFLNHRSEFDTKILNFISDFQA